MLEIRTKTAAQTQKLGNFLGTKWSAGDLVLLNGELGAGKTTLVRGVVAGAGGPSSNVTSPSYTYLNIYQADYPVYHLDVYLLNSIDDLYQIGIEELYPQGLVIIEWGSKFASDLLGPYWEINIAYTDVEQERTVTIRPPENRLYQMKELASFGDFNV